MKSFSILLAVGWAIIATFGSVASAETTVTLKHTHLCCGACVKAVGKALETVEGASAQCDREKKTVTISAMDDKTAKKALTALASAGFHGTSDNKKLAMRKIARKAPKGKVSRIELFGIHNCCGGCNKAIKKVIEEVGGIEADTAEAKKDSFVVEGNFNARKLIRTLNKNGFHVRLTKDEEGNKEATDE